MSDERTRRSIEVRNLVKHFPITRGIIFQKQIGAVKAVDDISFEVKRGETLGHRGRDRLRQEHDGPAAGAPARPHLGADPVRRRGHRHSARAMR